MSAPTLTRVTGALAEARPLPQAALYELARVGRRRLLGEVIRVSGDRATLQVYEDTAGLAAGEPVEPTGGPLTAQLGPGLLGSIVDGVGRPLRRLAEVMGDFILPGTAVETLDPELRWHFAPTRRPGDAVGSGDVLGVVAERPDFEHRLVIEDGLPGLAVVGGLPHPTGRCRHEEHSRPVRIPGDGCRAAGSIGADRPPGPGREQRRIDGAGLGWTR